MSNPLGVFPISSCEERENVDGCGVGNFPRAVQSGIVELNSRLPQILVKFSFSSRKYLLGWKRKLSADRGVCLLTTHVFGADGPVAETGRSKVHFP